MKKVYFALSLILFISSYSYSQITGIYTDYQGFWESNSGSINNTKPDNSHLLLGFKFNGTTYSTGVNDAALTANGVTGFTADNFRGLPLSGLPSSATGGSYFVGLGQLYDGLDNAMDNDPSNPFNPITSDADLAYFLTDGDKGLDLGTGIANTPTGQEVRFDLSSNKITSADISDGIPDIVVSNIANPSGSNNDNLRFINGSGVTVGNPVSINMSSSSTSPIVGNWLVDFYNFNSTSGGGGYVKTQRNLRFLPIELSQFGITTTNSSQVVALIYTAGGTSDPAFIAYNEQSIGVASKLAILAQPTDSECDGTMNSNFQVEVQDFNGAFIPQAGFPITASIYSGPGELLGTTKKLTDATGKVIFDNLEFEIGGDHQIIFESSSLEPAITTNIAQKPSCGDTTWTGAVNSDWNNPSNWKNGVPNANVNVFIPQHNTPDPIPNYPILNIDAGVKNLTMSPGASINLNGFLFAIEGLVTQIGGNSFLDGSTPGSNLYFSGGSAQSIDSGLLNGNLAQLTIENSAGVALNTTLSISEVLKIKEGNFETNDNLTLVCDFAQLGAAQVDRVEGSISGEMTIEQCFPARRAFRLVSSPVTTSNSIRANWQEGASGYLDNPNPGYGTHITGLGPNPNTTADGTNGFDYNTSGNSSLFTFDNTNASWTAIPSTLVPLNAGNPYRLFVRGDRSINILNNSATPEDTKIRATGDIQTGTVTLTNFNASEGAYNFFGNPYAAAVDMRKVFNNPLTLNTTRSYYIYDPNLGGSPTVGQPGGRGAFVAIDLDDLSSSVLQGASGTSEANRFLQPMQAAFFITSNESVAPQLVFRESDKNVEATATDVFRPASLNYNSIAINLYTQEAFTNQQSPSDGLRISFAPQFDNAVNYSDTPKMGNLDENIARLDNQNYLAIEKRELPTENEELPLFINQYRYDDYVLSINLNEAFEHKLYLDDAYLQTSTLLGTGNNAIAYQVDASIPASISGTRFTLRFGEANLNTDTQQTADFYIYPNPISNNTLHIELPQAYSSNKLNVDMFNVMGQKVLSKTVNTTGKSKISLSNLALPSGIYYLTITNNENGVQHTTKVINP
jgi:hypothetical protein